MTDHTIQSVANAMKDVKEITDELLDLSEEDRLDDYTSNQLVVMLQSSIRITNHLKELVLNKKQ